MGNENDTIQISIKKGGLEEVMEKLRDLYGKKVKFEIINSRKDALDLVISGLKKNVTIFARGLTRQIKKIRNVASKFGTVLFVRFFKLFFFRGWD